jgi:hypothetical protein
MLNDEVIKKTQNAGCNAVIKTLYENITHDRQ